MKHTDKGMQVFDEGPEAPDEKTMTMQEIAERLRVQFPGQCTCVTLEAYSYTSGRVEVKLSAYTDKGSGHSIAVGSVEEAFAVLDRVLNTTPSKAGEHEVAAVDMGAAEEAT